MRGRDIKRYSYDFADLWLINTHNGVKEKGLKRIEIADYPAIKKHLDQYYSQLVRRSDQGDTPYNLRNCAYTDHYFDIQKYENTPRSARWVEKIPKSMIFQSPTLSGQFQESYICV